MIIIYRCRSPLKELYIENNTPEEKCENSNPQTTEMEIRKESNEKLNTTLESLISTFQNIKIHSNLVDITASSTLVPEGTHMSEEKCENSNPQTTEIEIRKESNEKLNTEKSHSLDSLNSTYENIIIHSKLEDITASSTIVPGGTHMSEENCENSNLQTTEIEIRKESNEKLHTEKSHSLDSLNSTYENIIIHSKLEDITASSTLVPEGTHMSEENCENSNPQTTEIEIQKESNEKLNTEKPQSLESLNSTYENISIHSKLDDITVLSTLVPEGTHMSEEKCENSNPQTTEIEIRKESNEKLDTEKSHSVDSLNSTYENISIHSKLEDITASSTLVPEGTHMSEEMCENINPQTTEIEIQKESNEKLNTEKPQSLESLNSTYENISIHSKLEDITVLSIVPEGTHMSEKKCENSNPQTTEIEIRKESNEKLNTEKSHSVESLNRTYENISIHSKLEDITASSTLVPEGTHMSEKKCENSNPQTTEIEIRKESNEKLNTEKSHSVESLNRTYENISIHSKLEDITASSSLVPEGTHMSEEKCENSNPQTTEIEIRKESNEKLDTEKSHSLDSLNSTYENISIHSITVLSTLVPEVTHMSEEKCENSNPQTTEIEIRKESNEKLNTEKSHSLDSLNSTYKNIIIHSKSEDITASSTLVPEGTHMSPIELNLGFTEPTVPLETSATCTTNEIGEIINQNECFEKQSDISSSTLDNNAECEKYKMQISELEKELKSCRQKTCTLEAEIVDFKRKENELNMLLEQETHLKEMQRRDAKEQDEQFKRLQVNEEALKNEVKELKALIKQQETKTQSEVQISRVMEEYEKSISNLISEKEKMKKERDTAQMHLANIEMAFSDVHQKYERCKAIVQGYKDNEESFKQDIAVNRETIVIQEQKYESLKAHAMAQLEKSNQELAGMKKQHVTEMAQLTAQLKRYEIKNTSLMESLQQKTKECEQLSAVCDEFIGNI